MKKLTFDITVNPFTRKLNIVVLMDNKIHEVKIYFEGTDWWGSFDIKNKVFDIHCLYDESFSVNVYTCYKWRNRHISRSKCKINNSTLTKIKCTK